MRAHGQSACRWFCGQSRGLRGGIVVGSGARHKPGLTPRTFLPAGSGVGERARVVPRAFRTVERVDGGMFIEREREAEQVEVLPLTFGVHRLGDDDRAVFDVPAQDHLGRRHLVRLGDSRDRAVAGLQVGAASHRGVCFDRDAVLLAECDDFALLPGRVQLDLVDRRPFAGLLVQTGQMLRQEVAASSHGLRRAAW